MNYPAWFVRWLEANPARAKDFQRGMKTRTFLEKYYGKQEDLANMTPAVRKAYERG